MLPHVMIRSLQRAVLALLLMGGMAASGRASIIYSTGFEPPTYAPGAVNGQDGWVGSGVVQGTTVKSGTQALQITVSQSPNFRIARHGISAPVAGAQFRFELDYRRSIAGSDQSAFTVGGDTGFIGQIGTANGTFFVGNNSAGSTGPAFAANTWYRLRLDLDFTTLTMVGYVDNVLLGSLPINNSTLPTKLTETAIELFAPTTGSMDVFVDNLSISHLNAVPEPSTIVALGIGLATTVFARRRNRRSDRV